MALDYFGARYYDPEIARWTAVDSVEHDKDLYNCCTNNPIKNIDPDGRIPVETAVDILSLGESVYSFRKDSYFTNAVFLAWDVVALFPSIPGSWVAKLGKCGGKLSAKASAEIVETGVEKLTKEALDQSVEKLGKESFGEVGEKVSEVTAKGPVKPADRGSYSDLKQRKKDFGQIEPVEMHEMPSYTAKKEAFKQKYGHYPQTAADRKMVRDGGIA